jgi:hypothetical protein
VVPSAEETCCTTTFGLAGSTTGVTLGATLGTATGVLFAELIALVVVVVVLRGDATVLVLLVFGDCMARYMVVGTEVPPAF